MLEKTKKVIQRIPICCSFLEAVSEFQINSPCPERPVPTREASEPGPRTCVPQSKPSLCQGVGKWGRPIGLLPTLMIWGFCVYRQYHLSNKVIVRKGRGCESSAVLSWCSAVRYLSIPRQFLHSYSPSFLGNNPELHSYVSDHFCVSIFCEDRLSPLRSLHWFRVSAQNAR